MKKALLIGAAALAAMAAAPASATAVIYNGNTYNAGDSFAIDFTGVLNPSAHAHLVMTFVGLGGTGDYLFNYALTNTSVSPSLGSNASAFGFNVSGGTLDLPNSHATPVVGDIDGIDSGSISGGFFVNICATAGSNCSGGANSGPDVGETFTGSLLMGFSGAVAPGTITLTQPLVRFQNTSPIGSDVGQVDPGGVPEPGTWAMMLLGFGVTGFAMRRQRQSKAIAQFA